MLGDAGSIASLVGVAVSLLGIGFAILQLIRLRGETRAAREAAEATRRTVSRDLAIADVSRLIERVQSLKEFHRQREWDRALYRYPDVLRGLIDIRSRYPALSESDLHGIQAGVTSLQDMEEIVETSGNSISQETSSLFNRNLSEIQLNLAELESRLSESA